MIGKTFRKIKDFFTMTKNERIVQRELNSLKTENKDYSNEILSNDEMSKLLSGSTGNSKEHDFVIK